MTRFKQRAYRVTLVIQLIVALLAGFAPVAFGLFAGGTANDQVVVVDQAGIGAADLLASGLGTGEIPGMTPLTISTEQMDADAARAAVKDGDIAGAVIVTGSADAPKYEIVTGGDSILDLNALQLQNAVVTASIGHNAAREGVAEADRDALLSKPSVTVMNTAGKTNDIASNFSGPKFFIANISIILIYMGMIMFGMWIAQGVVEEKASRIMEIMVNAATPRDLLFGKVVGVLIAGLCQMVPMLLAGATMFALQPRIAEALNVKLPVSFDFDLTAISVKLVGFLLTYLIFGYLLYGALFAATASMVSRQEEVNQAVGPVMILIIAGLMLAYTVIGLPNSIVAKWLFFIPITSPFTAMPRILLGDPSATDIAISIAILAVSAAAAMWLAAKIYRTGVLLYGQKTGLKQLLQLRRMQQVAR